MSQNSRSMRVQSTLTPGEYHLTRQIAESLGMTIEEHVRVLIQSDIDTRHQTGTLPPKQPREVVDFPS